MLSLPARKLCSFFLPGGATSHLRVLGAPTCCECLVAVPVLPLVHSSSTQCCYSCCCCCCSLYKCFAVHAGWRRQNSHRSISMWTPTWGTTTATTGHPVRLPLPLCRRPSPPLRTWGRVMRSVFLSKGFSLCPVGHRAGGHCSFSWKQQ